MKNSKKLLILVLALGLMFAGTMLSSAAESDEEDTENTENTEEEDFACASVMLDEGFTLVSNYENFLNEYFQIDQPSSQQIETAMNYYRALEEQLENLYASALDLGGKRRTFDLANQEMSMCSQVRNQYIEYARVLLHGYARNSANSKRTFKVIDGLKAMNSDLEELADDFNLVFPGAFNKMDSALPCYASQCIQQ